MNRSSWKFTYTADKLFQAADSKKSWHMERLKWWSDKRKEVENNSGRNPYVSIRNDLVKHLSECVMKTTEHEGKCREYDAWMQVLASQGQTSLELHQDDWLFFFGK